MPAHKVLLVEDDPQTRARLADVVGGHPELELVGAVGNVADGRKALAEQQPQVLITDLGLPDGDGTELIRTAVEADAHTLCMVITVFGDERHVLSAIEAGALGYLLKDGTAESITESIQEMIAGGSPISSPIARYLLRRLKPEEPAASKEEVPKLSKREREVLTFVVKGFSYNEIAKLMDVSPHTVTTHVRGIYRKLAVSSRGEAVYEALQMGIVSLDE